MIFYPNDYFKRVSDITYDYLAKNNIKGLLIDVDNTLIDYYENISKDTINWAEKLKRKNIKLCILSNSNNLKKVKRIADKLEIDYISFAMKPSKKGFIKAKNILNLENKNIAVLGDQIFTDVIGANRMDMYSILIEPVDKKDIFLTLIKRPIENYVKKKYLQTKEK